MKRNGKVIRKIVLIAMGAVLVLSIFLTVVGVIRIRNTYETMAQEELRACCNHLDVFLEAAYHGSWTVDVNDEIIINGYNRQEEIQSDMDKLKEITGIDYTIFIGDTRRATTILKDGSTERSIGTQASDIVKQHVLDGEEPYLAKDIEIEGQTYFGYYVPLRSTSGVVNGMIFAGKVGKIEVFAVDRSDNTVFFRIGI